jgi:hypothetical protein
VLQRASACFSVLQRSSACLSVLQRASACFSVLQRASACFSVLQRASACLPSTRSVRQREPLGRYFVNKHGRAGAGRERAWRCAGSVGMSHADCCWASGTGKRVPGAVARLCARWCLRGFALSQSNCTRPRSAQLKSEPCKEPHGRAVRATREAVNRTAPRRVPAVGASLVGIPIRG